MSIADIVTKHHLSGTSKSPDNMAATNQTTIKWFTVAKGAANRYEQEHSSEDDDLSQVERTVEVKVLDILFNNQLCALVYVRDVTSLLA